jgi:hypothetical protein
VLPWRIRCSTDPCLQSAHQPKLSGKGGDRTPPLSPWSASTSEGAGAVGANAAGGAEEIVAGRGSDVLGTSEGAEAAAPPDAAALPLALALTGAFSFGFAGAIH